MPIDPNDRNTAYKYPFNSVKLLCLDIPEITKILFEETIINTFGERNSKLKNNMNFKENFSSELYQNHMSLDTLHEDISKEYNLLEHFFTFLRNKNNNCNNVLCGYFYQVFKFLIFKEQEIILDILFKQNKFHINNMIALCRNTSICKCILEILNCNFKQNKIYISYQEFICMELLNNKIYIEDYTVPICENIFIPLFRNNDLDLSTAMINNFHFKEIFFNLLFSQIQPFKIINLSNVKLCQMIANAILESIQITSKGCQEKDIEICITQNNNAFNSYSDFDKRDQLCKYLHIKEKEVIKFLLETSHTIIEYLNRINYIKYFDMIYVIEYLTKCFHIVKYYLNKNNDKNASDNNRVNNYQNIFKNVFTEKLYLTLTIKLLENPRNNIYHIAYIELITVLSDQTGFLINKNVISRYMSYLVNIYPKHRELLAPVIKILSIMFENYDIDIDNNKDEFTTNCFNLKQFIKYVIDLFLENTLDFDEDLNITLKTREHTFNELINNGITQYLKFGCDKEDAESESVSMNEELEQEHEKYIKINNRSIKIADIDAIKDNDYKQKGEKNIIKHNEDLLEQHITFSDSFYWKSDLALSMKDQDWLNELKE